jgi:hypothetical protein
MQQTMPPALRGNKRDQRVGNPAALMRGGFRVMEFRLGTEQRVCDPGDVVVIPGGSEYEAWFREDTEVTRFFRVSARRLSTWRQARVHERMSSPRGHVEIEWKIRQVPGAPRKLAIAWSEHGGPAVQYPQRHGFGSRLIKRAVDGYGGVRMDFNSRGLACFMLIDLERSDARMHELGGETRRYRSKPRSHSTK